MKPNKIPAWTYNEFKQIGVNFDDPKQVEAYDARQKTSLGAERELVTRLGIKGHHTVLEYGPGTGAFAIAAGETGAQVVAVDISSEMLAFAGRKAKEAKLESVQFQRGGYLTHDQPAESVDFVVTKFALHHLPDFWKVAALRRMFRSLKPRGQLYIQDVVFSFAPDDHSAELETWINGAVQGGGFSRADFETHIRDEFSTYGDLLERILRLAGFRVQTANYYSKVQAEYFCERAQPGRPETMLAGE